MIAETREANDAIGGTITCVVKNAPAGWGEPAFDKLEATLAHAMLSLRSAKVQRAVLPSGESDGA